MEVILIILISVLASIIAAVPFGLVNLTVMNISYKKGLPTAMKIARGAAITEILFVSIAIFSGQLISEAVHNFNWMQWLFISIPVLTGLFFLLKKNRFKAAEDQKRNPFFYGAALNLISVQVLLYWIFASAFINNMPIAKGSLNAGMIIAILISVWITKLAVLWTYAKLSNLILNKFQFLSARINQVIGFILILTGIFQYFKI